MATSKQVPELQCMEGENYKKHFRSLCWSENRKAEKKSNKKISKKEKQRRLKAANTLAVCFAPALVQNPSQFAVYAAVRSSILARWRQLHVLPCELSDESENDDSLSPVAKIPKITGIGLRTVFALISQARHMETNFCELALKALLDVLQGHAPEELAKEPTEIISNLHAMLVEVASGSGMRDRAEMATNLTALSCSCLIALSVARGEAELILNAVASLIMSPPVLSEQNLKVPTNLIMLQRSVQSVVLGSPSRNQWLHNGVPHQSLVTSFPVDLPSTLSGAGELIVRSLVSDGCYLYIFTSKGLLKIGSGYGCSIRQHVYSYKQDFFGGERHGWLGYCKDKLYVKIGRKKNEVYELDKESLEVKSTVRLEAAQPASLEPKSAVFTDGNQLGLISVSNYDMLTIRMYDVGSVGERGEGGAASTLSPCKELKVNLLRRRTLALGRASFEDLLSRRPLDLDAPVAMQLDDDEDDRLLSICGGQDFALLTTASGKVYYTGKGSSLGYKAAIPQTSRWTLIKENTIMRNDLPHSKRAKIHQVAVGHEGVHAIFVLDNGTAMFAGVARRGEDGDTNKHRRAPKPTRPKKIYKADGHQIVYAACNYGSTALITRQGMLLMFGKDTQFSDSTGVVPGLRHERIIQVALGKAHAVALTNFGDVYTFGINNKGQCGRDYGSTKDKMCTRTSTSNKEELRVCQSTHTWANTVCRVCQLCRECTGSSSDCPHSQLPNRVPGDECGCGEGEGGCITCGICRRCAEAFSGHSQPGCSYAADLEDEPDAPSDSKSEKESGPYPAYEGHTSGSDAERERDPSIKVTSLSPARIAIPGGHRVINIACGLHHTILLAGNGDVFTFGSNQFGQLGVGDITPHHRIVKVRVPRAIAVAAGSNHSAVLTKDGELYTFGSYQNGSLGRARVEEAARADRTPIWYATPGRVPRLGPRYACKAVWVSASGDQTFVQVSHSLIKTDTLFSATITANNNCIMILPNRPEHTFKCITINKTDGTCNAWPGSEQVDFVNTLASLDPLYDVLWCYQPQMRVIKCYNILLFDSHKIHRCCNIDTDEYSSEEPTQYPSYGNMRRLEDFKNLENFDLSSTTDEKPIDNAALSNMTVLNQELAIPSSAGHCVTRMHAALHLLGCLDSLNYAHDARLGHVEHKRENATSPEVTVKEEYLTVNRFEGHGGGWGYSGHSVEAIRFMCDTDILLVGYGLFGGRGDYTAKIKVYDIGPEGGDHEADGELLAESEQVMFECAPRDRFPMLFDVPVQIQANRWYVAWACLNGPSSDCGSSGQAMVINDDVGFHFKSSKRSNNGTDVNAGQIPSLLYNITNADQAPPAKSIDLGEPIIVLSKNISRKVTVPCFRSLITLLSWSWSTFKGILFETNGLVPINYHKLTVMKNQKGLVYVIRSCLRLVKSYVNEIYPQNNRKRNSQEYMSYFEAISVMKNLILSIMSEATPTCNMLPRRPGKPRSNRICYVQFALEMTNSILQEAHETITSCFHAFFPTPTLKWTHLCSLLAQVREGVVLPSQMRVLTATCAAMCASRSLRDVLHYVLPRTEVLNDNRKLEAKVSKDVPSKSATVPRSSHAQKPPPVPPRSNTREARKSVEPQETSRSDWHLPDMVRKLLDIVLIPIKQQMMTRPCSQSHDHGEIKQRERLTEFCCKLMTRIIAELAHSASNLRDAMELNTVKHQVTPSRFMRVNQTRAWNTGNGSPDAICFSVDRPGVALIGVYIYGGPGTYEYTLELLHDVRLRAKPDEAHPAHCWVSLEVVSGTFSAADCVHDMVLIKFDAPVPLKEEFRYAIRLCNNGGRSAHGDCGLPSVKGPDGTTFRFAFCSLSFNGTTIVRGQIPSLIYYNSTKTSLNTSECTDSLMHSRRGMTICVATAVLERSTELLCSLRNELTAEDLRRNAPVLNSSPAVTLLLPYTLANLESLDDAKSGIKLLEVIHKMLPQVTALNQMLPSAEDTIATTGQHYTWVESEHPYKQATATNLRVLFPANVSWTLLEMDPRSVTAQPEDTLTVYAVAGAPDHRCRCATEHSKQSDPPFRKVFKRIVQLTSESGEAEEESEDGEVDAFCMHYNCTYVSVTPKLANAAGDWPQKAILVPGNEVIFSLETSTDYLKDYSKGNNDENRFGFRCLCVGYEDAPMTTQRQGLLALEMEIVYMASLSASRLLTPALELPAMSFPTVMEVQLQAILCGSSTSEEGDTSALDGPEAVFLSKGLELSSPPSIHHVVDGQPLLRSGTTARQFLCDFVAGDDSTAGGRLARWLAPMPRVEPSKCELLAPPSAVQPAVRLNLPLIIRDQYGDSVTSPALVVEVVVQRMEDTRARQARKLGLDDSSDDGYDMNYHPTTCDNVSYQSITVMRAFQDFSFEELRLASGAWGDVRAKCGVGARVPAERLSVTERPDGSYIASWMPRMPGTYLFRCTFDDQPGTQEVIIEVSETSPACHEEHGAQANGSESPPAKLSCYEGQHSAGLRVRASPSLQAEEIGSVPPGTNVSFVEEVVNKDGTWVRLSADSARAFAGDAACVAWCIQHHRHFDRELLVPVEPPTPPESEMDGARGSADDALGDDGLDFDLTVLEEKFPFTVPCDPPEEDERNLSPFVFGAEPSKRGRVLRKEFAAPSRKRLSERRSNGNKEDWWSPERRKRFSDDCDDIEMISDTEMELDPQVAMDVDAPTAMELDPPAGSDEPASDAALTSPASSHDRTMLPNTFDSTSKEEGGEAEPVRAGRGVSPVAGRAPSPPPPPKKRALSPVQAECMRAVFAALLWHEGLVPDSIACAAFLKFHPHLPKQGARVVTRSAHGLIQPRHQRHSVEVSNAGQYLRIEPSTLDVLTRLGEEASSNRSRHPDISVPITEEEPQPHSSNTAPDSIRSVVNVLPLALRAMVALWDALNDADQLAVATDKNYRDSITEEINDARMLQGSVREKRNWKNRKTPYLVLCEVCSNNVPPPLSEHMRRHHEGCRLPTTRGYDRTGEYKILESKPGNSAEAGALCGQVARAGQLWYMYCEKCHDKLEGAPAPKQPRPTVTSESNSTNDIDYHTIKDNALFLLDIAPLNNSESSTSPWHGESSRSGPTAAGSLWQPAPPFQCLAAFGAAPKDGAATIAARFHSLGRPPPPAPATQDDVPAENAANSVLPRVHRSVSMGQVDGKEMAHSSRQPLANDVFDDSQDTLSGAASLLTQPSAALLNLVGCGDWGDVSTLEPMKLDSEALMRSPVLSFVLARHDLVDYKQLLDAAIRISTVRQYAFEAFNWLLRSASQPTCVHDVMWWFCSVLDKFARIVPSPLALEELKENAVCDNGRGATPTASATVICPGGRSGRGARAAFHAFMGSLSALAPSLPPTSAVALQAVRCWALHFSQHDRAFLHRSQVFSVISKILSHSETNDPVEEEMLEVLQESTYSPTPNKELLVWKCPDVSSWCDLVVSSRPSMAGALTDGSTETFWESGDEDRNKTKWLEISYSAVSAVRPHIICVHVDNTRDTVNKINLVSFLFSTGSSEMFHMQDFEVEPKAATWICYTLPRVPSNSGRVRCELRGPEPTVRVRQVCLLAAPVPHKPSDLTVPQLLHSLITTDTLRVFRLLTTQVFGKLLTWEKSEGETGEPVAGPSTAVEVIPPVDDTDLREHVVGILFSGHKLTTLQKQVMSHIVTAVGCESVRVREEWEVLMLNEKAAERDPDAPIRIHNCHPDTYCFEMLALLLALSGSAVGRAQLAHRTELLADLLTLLHTGSERVQRQVILLLRRMIAEIPPQKAMTAFNGSETDPGRVSLVTHLASYLGKAITVQVKVKGAGAGAFSPMTMGATVVPSPPAVWFMRGITTNKHAHLVAKLLADMAEDKVTELWGVETRSGLATMVRNVAQVAEGDRCSERCLASPTVWLALAALCVCDQRHLNIMNGTEEGSRSSTQVRAVCTNHDDGATIAAIECQTCGALCAECDRFLHLNRASRSHLRQVYKEEESAIRVDIHEGCGRAKLFWLLLLVDRRTLKALVEFRVLEGVSEMYVGDAGGPPALSLAGVCRFCGTRSNTGLLAIGNVCADQNCQEYGREACVRILPCGHVCGGVVNESVCLPCLVGCAGAPDVAPLRQDGDDMCMICFTDPLRASPAIQLKCGHVFHYRCCKQVLANKWVGPRITFSFSQCPICKEDMSHSMLDEELVPIRRLCEEVKRKALMRLEYEGMAAASSSSRGPEPDPAQYAMDRYAYYVCYKCGKAYFGGLARCEVELSGVWNPAELVCGACSDVTGARSCPKHGADFLEYKCRYCCSVAVFFCFGTSHFCNACHDDFQRIVNIPRHQLPQCPTGPKCEQLPGSAEECPLHVVHPATGEEFALGCGVCRHAHAF